MGWMKKFFLVFFSIVLIVGGIYGAYFIFTLRHADEKLNAAALDIKGGRYDQALETLKSVISEYRIASVRAPALYLLADAYERSGKYIQARDIHKMLLSSRRISNRNNWRMMSLIAVSTMYRNGLIPLGDTRKRVLDNYISVIKEKIEDRTNKTGLYLSVAKNGARRLKYCFLSQNSGLRALKMDDDAVTAALETELGFLYLSREKFEDAEKIFNRLDTNKSKLGRALLYFETGRYKEGELLLQELLVYDPTGRLFSYYVQELFRTAENLYRNRSFGEALKLYKKIIGMTKNNIYEEISLYRLVSYYYKKGKYVDSLHYIDRMLENSVPDKDEEALLIKGYIYYDRRKYVQALRIFNDFLKRFPNSTRAKTASEWKAMCERSIRYLN